jgi:hypothetical protein
MSDDTAIEQDCFLFSQQERRDIPDDVTHVMVHPSVRAIKGWVFSDCRQLLTVILNDGLEEIEVYAFNGCTSLVCMAIPPTVRVIKACAFYGCSGLRTAILNNGLEEIGAYAFQRCTSLVHITLPPVVEAIKDWAFDDCLGLMTAILNNGL